MRYFNNKEEYEAELKDLAYDIHHDKLELEKQIKKYTLKIKEPKGLFSAFKFGFYQKKLEIAEKRLEKVVQYEARIAKVIEDYHKTPKEKTEEYSKIFTRQPPICFKCGKSDQVYEWHWNCFGCSRCDLPLKSDGKLDKFTFDFEKKRKDEKK